jgi:6-pyruvoyltetrahydropterin/6-carboxytetrahydropterin synthase
MKISKKYSFDSAHILPRHKGKCGQLHGHTYVIDVCIEGPIDYETQFVIDYGELDDIMAPLLKKYDHQLLNDFITYPSAENIATAVADYLIKQFKITLTSLLHAAVDDKRWRICRIAVGVSETPKTLAIWDSYEGIDLDRLSHSTGEWRAPEPGTSTRFLIEYLQNKEQQARLV